MLKRIYANNFRCLVNFEIEFDELTLLLGPNGGGKSTLFDLLINIRRLLVDQARVGDVFTATDLTAWIDQSDQSFELDIQDDDGLYSYRLIVSHDPELKKERITYEHLLLNGKPLFQCEMGEVHLYRDNYSSGPAYSSDWTISALAMVGPRNDNKKLTWFKERIHSFFIISLQPKSISSTSEDESEWLNNDGSNFASWFRFHSQENQDKIHALTEQLRHILPGFHNFKLELAGKVRLLKIGFLSADGKTPPVFFEFSQLSDGQRVLIVLYSLLLGLRDLGLTLFIDEPENYVALPEIQPWLMELKDVCGEGFPQTVLISHHPEFIDYLGHDCGVLLERDPLGPVRVKKLPEIVDSGLKLSELIARGWME